MKKSKQEATMAVVAALIVLFSAMLDPKVSVAITLIALVVFSVYKFKKK